jgi:4-hydroxy-3-methylbut-2-enyl diphosphate reductase
MEAFMEVLLAEHMGFCYGVRRAVDMATTAARKASSVIFTLGPLIHNPQMIERLQGQGVEVLDSLDSVDAHNPATVLIRSHGVGPNVYEQAARLTVNLLDATCPHVKLAQSAAKKYADQGVQVVVAGERTHPEVKSILEWAGPNAVAVETAMDIADVPFGAKVGLVSQTTLEREVFDGIVTALRQRDIELDVSPTICRATEDRQTSAIKLAEQVEVMLVVGGHNSANTRHLAEVCRKSGAKTYHIETAAELVPKWFLHANKVGITAGASTPDWIIEEVRQRMENMDQVNLNTGDRLEKGAIVAGKVVGVNHDFVFVDIGQKAEGVIALTELAWPVPADAHDVVAVGQLLNVLVLDPETTEGSVQLSKLQADRLLAWDRMEEAMKEGQPIEVTVTAAVKGGLSISAFGLRCFIPASQVDSSFVEDLAVYVGKTFEAQPIEVDRDKQRAVFSRRTLLEAQRRASEATAIEKLSVGQVLTGEVRRLATFGAFVDVGGIEGLVHVSEMAWHRVKDAADIVKVGDEVQVQVLKVDKELRKISLGMKQLQPDPWNTAVAEFAEGTTVPGKVTRTIKFGAFVELAPGVEGLVHISELSDRRVATPEEVVQIGQKITVKVLSVDPVAKRISLSVIKAQEDADRKEFAPFLGEHSSLGVTIGDKLGHLFKKREE